MVSAELKKFAAGKGMKVSNGICYGSLNGYTVSFSDSGGNRMYKEIYISARTDESTRSRITEALNSEDAVKNYKIDSVELKDNFIYIRFINSMGIMKRFSAFIEWFMPVVSQSGAQGENVCPECGGEINGGGVKKLIGGHAAYLHEGCANALIEAVKSEEDETKAVNSNAGRGLLGALLFGIIGAIPWAAVYALGWFVGWLGALIGAAIVKGYSVFGGNLKKAVIPVMAVLVIVCVLFAQVLGDVFQVGYYIIQGDLYGELSDIPEYMSYLYQDSEYRLTFIKNVVIGLIFAALGVWGIFKTLIKSVSSVSKTIVDLE